MRAVGNTPNIGVFVSVEFFTLLRGFTGVTVCMVEDGFKERSSEMPWVERGGVERLDLGEIVTQVGTSGDERCGVVTEGVVRCSGGVGRRAAVGGSIAGSSFSVVHGADRGSF